jgi:hypothetical protein
MVYLIDQNQTNLNRFFRLMYEPHELVWVQQVMYKNRQCWSMPQDIAMKQFWSHRSTDGVYLAINGTIENTNRNKDKSALRTLLLEFDADEHGHTLTPFEQCNLVRQAGLTPTAAIWSGGKSVHFWFCLESPFTQIGEYTEWWIRLSLLCQSRNDKATKDPSRFSRFPTAYRGEQQQSLLILGDRIPNNILHQKLFSDDITRLYQESNVRRQGSTDVTFQTVPRSLPDCIRWLNEQYPLVTGVKQGNMMVWAKMLVGSCGLRRAEDIIMLLSQHDRGHNKLPIEYARVADKAISGLQPAYITEEMWRGADVK